MLSTENQKTQQGFEWNFGVNHLANFALLQVLQDCLLKSSTPPFNSRVVMVASIGHRMSEVHLDDPNFEHREWAPIPAYGQSKTANIYMANYIDRKYGAFGLHAWSLQPGGIASNLIRRSEEEKTAIYGDPAIRPWVKTPQQGAATTVWAAISKDLEGRGGKYLESMQEIHEWKGPDEMRIDWTDPGFAPYAYDKEKEDRLWQLSEKLIK